MISSTSWQAHEPELREPPSNIVPAYRVPAAPPDKLESCEKSRLRAAAAKATRTFPGAIGQVLARELQAHEEFAYRTAPDGLLMRLVRQLESLPERAS